LGLVFGIRALGLHLRFFLDTLPIKSVSEDLLGMLLISIVFILFSAGYVLDGFVEYRRLQQESRENFDR
jgi:hypothetical protein